MIAPLDKSWELKLQEEFKKPYFESLSDFVISEYANKQIFPPQEKIFNAFNHCSFDDIKVVIIGQDPYHGDGQANGLCFSVADGIKQPPSLVNIFKEIEGDLGVTRPTSGNLERWSEQGVLLLNATLTVEAHSAGSHQKKGWEKFTDAVIKKIAEEKEGVVFFLWGAYAQKKGKVIDPKKHLVVQSVHPSPLSAHRGFFGNHQFSKANDYLASKGKSIIKW
ncbi:uracil-DNA glycosylase [Flammeovirga kamogawensis]|uniref:Uracil-DNA glycosylase n=1 Tax=Flammeovirga kamogawensis TaxID=373891 RepID=A0ABX8GUH8_9BACT|nr:uracil-DNA glycosylase [Flammeovirga kamogawensis]MBB6459760.1 uracil-DNA glycosylase [Flammeovirga kamogawensis]QWG07181.1 uracil-DNA glycosylase [Flammeovirga kamogawensis]TRX69002.1 uracil-DNA glycosylase [Flammeovirga kamogawensis]